MTGTRVYPQNAAQVAAYDKIRRSRAAFKFSAEASYAPLLWRDVGSRLCRSTTWTAALKMQTLVVRNAAAIITTAWISTTFCASGNIFSGKWYTDQSRNELIVANSVWGIVLFCTIEFASFLVMTSTFRFIDARPTAWNLFKRLVRASFSYFFAAVGVTLVFSYVVARLASTTPVLFKYKIDCYMNTLAGIGYFAGISRVANTIYHEETQQGRDRLRAKQHNPRKRMFIKPTPPERRQSTIGPLRLQLPPYWKAYIKALPTALPSLLACMFIQVLSQQRLVDSSQTVLTSFTIASVAFKLIIQELAKHYIFKTRVRSTRIMCFIVGIPTVLIDTQTRMILLGTNNQRIAALGTIGMAVLEISLRMGKAALVMWEIHRRKPALSDRTDSAARFHGVVSMFRRSKANITAPEPASPTHPMTLRGDNDFEQWKHQVQKFYVAELNADMYAEYVSIGCSASIFFFYGNHAHYELLRRSNSSETARISMNRWRAGQLSILALQIVVEITVDYVSTVLEMVVGIEFSEVRKLSLFLGGLFVGTAVLNTVLSVQVFLS